MFSVAQVHTTNMACSYFCLSNDTYKNHVFEGFSQFQQTEEFVDMTVAAEGHLVKVHQTIISLASPYLKHLIKSVPCQHPVLFLNNVSHELLSFILEYIYTGEVKLPDKKVQPFLKVAQAMHLKGLDNILPHTEYKLEKEAPDVYHENRPPTVEDSIKINNIGSNFKVDPEVETANIEEFIQQTAPIPSDIAESEESNQFVGTIDLSSAVTSNSVTINIGNSGPTNLKIREADTVSNKDTINYTASQATEDVPMIIHHQVPQLDEPFLISNNGATTVSGYNINNQNNITIDNNSTDFSNLFNISNGMPLDNDLAVDVSISDLLDCNKVATPSTINDTDIVELQSENVEIMPRGNVENIQTENGESKQTKYIVNIPSERVEFEDGSRETILYSISNRGSLQIIMNHYMFYTHYQAYGGRKRRWRCIDYRDKHCTASVDTDNGVVVRREQKHCHPNHEKQIWKRAVKNKIFSTLRSVEEIITKSKNNTNEMVVLTDTEDDD